jgi:hypothetical protein
VSGFWWPCWCWRLWSKAPTACGDVAIFGSNTSGNRPEVNSCPVRMVALLRCHRLQSVFTSDSETVTTCAGMDSVKQQAFDYNRFEEVFSSMGISKRFLWIACLSVSVAVIYNFPLSTRNSCGAPPLSPPLPEPAVASDSVTPSRLPEYIAVRMKQPLTTLIAGESGSFELEARLKVTENTTGKGCDGTLKRRCRWPSISPHRKQVVLHFSTGCIRTDPIAIF